MRERFLTPRLPVTRYHELNAWRLDRCLAYAQAHKHPALSERTIWQAFEAERPKLAPITAPLDGFTFAETPINESLVRSLATGVFLAEQRNALLIGGTGTGTSHLAMATARSCIRAGARGRFHIVLDLVNRLESEARAGRQDRLADHLTRRDLVGLDEFGYLPFAQTGGQLLFHPISRLHQRTSIILTTNLVFAEWPSVFGDPTLS